MNKVIFSLILVIFAGIVSAKEIPVFPQTYTAKIEGRKEVSGELAKEFNYMQYSIANQFYAQEGKMSGDKYQYNELEIVNMTALPSGFQSVVLAGGMFNHHTTCARLPVYVNFPSLSLQFDAKLEGEVECPSDSYYHNANTRCDHWSYVQFRSDPPVTVDWYVTADDNTPVQWSESYLHIKFIYNIVSFDTSKEPDMEHFMVPSGCGDYTVSGTPIYSDSIPVVNSKVAKKYDPKFTLVNDAERIARINSMGLSWKAAPAKAFDGMTVEEFRKTKLTPLDVKHRIVSRRASFNSMSVAPEIHVDKIPESFDASQEWPRCNIDVIRDQAQCGSCWSFGAAESLGDRFCIAHNKTSFGPLKLAPQYAVSCFVKNDGCNGGLVDVVWDDLMETGLVEESCFPYEQVDKECPTTCEDGSPMKMYKARSAYPLFSLKSSDKTEEMIQKEIMTHGPVEAAFYVFDDFMYYSGGVYYHPEGSYEPFGGGHAVKIYGWGVDKESGLPYWLVANSWGTSWGENGNFRVLRGKNECGFEDEVVAGLPRLRG